MIRNIEYLHDIKTLWDEGLGYAEISRQIIKKYNLNFSVDYFRKEVSRIIKYELADKDIIEANVRLAKQKQRQQDLNRIYNKSFREHARVENAVEEYNHQLVKLLKENQFKTITKDIKLDLKGAMIVHIADTHFNELVDLDCNKYDFEIASKRLQKFAHHVKRYSDFYKVDNILIAITGDLMNSDRRLDEKLAMSTNRAKATFLAVHLLKHFIVDIGKNKNVSVSCVTGNESRVTQELGWVDIVASDNYDFTIFEMLKLLLPDINFISGNPNELIIKVANKNILMMHGHQLGKMDSTRIAKVISKFSRKGVEIDFMICGHLHETCITDFWARSSSLVGANAYSENSLNLSSRASQNIYIFSEDGRHDIRIDLQDSDFEGYDIDLQLASYNAKSLSKTKQKQTIFEIII
jgi:predicted phosphodiesterase